MAQLKVSIGADDIGVFDDEKITLQDAFAIKAASGLSLKPFMEGLADMDPLALQTLVWFLKHKLGNAPNLAEVDFVIADLNVEEVASPPA